MEASRLVLGRGEPIRVLRSYLSGTPGCCYDGSETSSWGRGSGTGISAHRAEPSNLSQHLYLYPDAYASLVLNHAFLSYP